MNRKSSFNWVTSGVRLAVKNSLRGTTKFCDSYGRDSKEGISDAEQLPVSSLKRNDFSRVSSSSLLAQMYTSLI